MVHCWVRLGGPSDPYARKPPHDSGQEGLPASPSHFGLVMARGGSPRMTVWMGNGIWGRRFASNSPPCNSWRAVYWDQAPTCSKRIWRGATGSSALIPQTGPYWASSTKYYLDICPPPPFGLKTSALFMQRTSEAISHIHGQRGHLSCPYLDDFRRRRPRRGRTSL